MVIILYFLTFLTTFILFLIIGGLLFTRKQNIVNRMETIRLSYSDTSEDDEFRKSFEERVIHPMYNKIIYSIGQITPAQILNKYQTLIAQSGSTNAITPSNLIAIQIMLGLLISSIMYLIQKLFIESPNLFIVFSIGIIGFFLPYSFFNIKAQKRQLLIQQGLPDLLDLLYISVEAGLSFDSAIKKSADKMKGPLSEEFLKALGDITKGRERQEALKNIVQRTGVDDLNTFVTAIIQSELLGSNISNTLRTQSETMRQKRRQRAEAAAAKLPVKMLFPLVFLIFPSLFIVVLTPAAISLIDQLKDVF